MARRVAGWVPRRMAGREHPTVGARAEIGGLKSARLRERTAGSWRPIIPPGVFMQVTNVIATLSVFASPVTIPSPQTNHPLTTFASASRTCAVIQAAYTAATGQRILSFPKDVRPSPRRLEALKDFVPEYRKSMSISEDEFDDLTKQQEKYNFPGFAPFCEWKGKPGPTSDALGNKTHVTFTSPIFSTAGNVALVEVSFRNEGVYGYGMLCTSRLSHRTWSSHCLKSWTT